MLHEHTKYAVPGKPNSGSDVTEFRPGDCVVATVRRPDFSIYDQIGSPDMTTNDTYFERGIKICGEATPTAFVIRIGEWTRFPPRKARAGI